MIIVFLVILAAAAITMGAGTQRKTEKTVTAGQNYDIYLGQCGMYVLNAPANGKIALERESKSNYNLRFVKDVCSVEYETGGRKTLSSFNGYLVYYISLSRAQHRMWEDGDLAFYTKGSSGWSKCSARLMGHGDFGRLTCLSNQFGSFGLVDIHEKDEKDDDEDKKAAKPPEGTFVTSGRSLDISQGNCGVYLSNVPADGYVDIEREDKGQYAPRFLKNVCDFSYVDAKDQTLSTGGALAIGYVNLTSAQSTAYRAGDLAFFSNSGRGWNECTNSLLMDENGTPRLCCTMSGPSMFGIADISEKD